MTISTLTRAIFENAPKHATTVTIFDAPSGQIDTTVGHIHQQALCVASGLRELGIGKGDAVAIQLTNRVEAVVAMEAVLMLGGVIVPIVHIYGPAEVDFVLRESTARILIIPDRWRSIDYGSRVASQLAIPTLQHIVVIGEECPTGTTRWSDLPADALAEPADVGPEDVCLLPYTSGTTSNPKGVQHVQRGMLAEFITQAAFAGRSANAIQLSSMPAGHMSGIGGIFRPLLLGTTSVFMDGWDPEQAINLIEKYGITYSSGTPFHLRRLLDAMEAGRHLSSLKEFVVGAATVPADIVSRADAFGVAAFRCYGSTEQPSITCGVPEDPVAKRQYTDGRPIVGNEVRIVDDADNDVPSGVDGHVVCRGPELFVGYQDPELNENLWLEGGWLRTGDIGVLDEEGYLTITDRAKDIIIRAGENISSREVEDVLLTHPDIQDAAAIAQPDPYYGERICAVVVPVAGREPSLQSVVSHFTASGLAKQKTPEFLVLRDDLPRTPTGKIRKADLRADVRDELAGPDTPTHRPSATAG